jgi:hypothetical protein
LNGGAAIGESYRLGAIVRSEHDDGIVIKMRVDFRAAYSIKVFSLRGMWPDEHTVWKKTA